MDSNTWTKLVSAVKSQSVSIGGLLNSAQIIELNNNSLKLGVYYKFHKDKLEEAKTVKMIEDAMCSILGTSKKIEFCLAEAPKTAQLTDTKIENIMSVAEQMFS